MARRAAPASRSKTRKPVTLDLTAEAPETVSVVEHDIEKSPVNDLTDDITIEMDAEPVDAEVLQAGSDRREDETPEVPSAEDKIETKPTQTTSIVKNRGLSALGGGIIGGMMTLVGAAGLQWSGVLPSMSTPAMTSAVQTDITPLQSEIAALRGQLDMLQNAQGVDDQLGVSPAIAQSIADAQSTAAEAAEQASQTRALLDSLTANVAGFSQALSAGAGGEAPALEALSARIDALQTDIVANGTSGALAGDLQQLDGLEADMGLISQTLEGLSGEMAAVKEMTAVLEQNQNSLAERLSALSADVAANKEAMADNGAGGTTVARAIAASGLKTAVDRGLPFMAELEAFATVGGDQEAIDALRDYAAKGVPTVLQLSDSFGPVANAIVATTQGLDESASIADRLMSSARSLVQMRPVGEVQGDDPTAIATQIEARLKEGNLGGALARWETLPTDAKAVSQGFAQSMAARNTVDTLTAKVLNQAMAANSPSQAQ